MTDPVHKTGRVASEPFWAANEGAMGAMKACVSHGSLQVVQIRHWKLNYKF